MNRAHALSNPAVQSNPRMNRASHATVNGSPAATPNVSTPATNGASTRLAPSTPAVSRPSRPQENHDLAAMLRRSLDDARGNPQIRERLEQLARDTARVEHIVRTLGARHSVVQELFRLRERQTSGAAA